MADFFVAKHTIKRSDGPFLVDFFSSWKFVNMLRSPWYKLIITDNSPLPPCIYSIGRFGKICWKSVTRRKNQPLLFSAGWWNWHRGRKAKTHFPEFWAGRWIWDSKKAGNRIRSGNQPQTDPYDGFSSKTKALMFGGNEMSFLIDIQGTGKFIIESLGGQLVVSSL